MTGRRLHHEERVREYQAKGWWGTETMDELLRARVAAAPDRLALLDPPNKADLVGSDPRRLTWAQVDEQVDRLAQVLLEHGLGQGSVVGTQLPNTVELVLVYLAAWRVGAIVTPFPVQYREHEIAELGALAELEAYVTVAGFAGRPLAGEVLGYRDLLPTMHTVLAFGPGVPDEAVDLDAAVRAADDRAGIAAHQQRHPADANDCVTICWTSGTESTPKGVPRCHMDWLAIGWGTLEAPQLSADDVMLNPFPMVNMAGISGMFLPWLRVGGVFVQHHPFDLPTFLRQIHTEHVTYTVAPPTLLTLLLAREEVLAQVDISTLRLIGSGAAPLPPSMVTGWQERHGIPIINFFGSNEGIPLLTDPYNVPDPVERARYFPRYGGSRTWASRVADWTSVRLVDADGNDVQEPGVPGELRISGPTVFAGYLGGDRLPSPFDERGYLRTGDVFTIAGEDGEFLEFVDRAKDLVVRGGFNIAAAEVESLLAGHPDVAEVAIVGVADDTLGERVCAVVVPKDGRQVTLERLVEYLRTLKVASYKLPERLELRESLPRNPVGKVLKRDLREQVAR